MYGNETKRFYNSHYPLFPGTFPTSDNSKLKYLYSNIPEQQWLEDIWFGKLKEVIDRYDPDMIWFMAELYFTYKQKFCAYFNKTDERGNLDKTGLILDVPASPDEISVVYKVELE